MKLTPEDAQRIEDKKLANVLRKIYEAKRTPTAREEAILAKALAGQTSGNLPAVAGYVGTWHELAQQLGVSRQAIVDWKKDPRYSAHCPADRADGRKEVAPWQLFMIRFGLKRADEHVGEADHDEPAEDALQPPAIGGTEAQWKKAIAALDHRKKENTIRVQEGELLVAADLEVPLGATFAAIQTKLSQFPDTAGPRVAGRRDKAECVEVLRDEMSAVLADLQGGRFDEPEYLPALVQELFPEREEPSRAELVQGLEAVLRVFGRTLLRTSPTNTDAAAANVVLERNAEASSDDDESAPAARAAALQTSAASSAPEVGAPKAKRKRKPRPQPAVAPAEIEGAMHEVPRRKFKPRG